MTENDYGRADFEARMRSLKCTVNLNRYKTGRPQYISKTVDAAWETWREAWARAEYQSRAHLQEQRRLAFEAGKKFASRTPTAGEAQ